MKILGIMKEQTTFYTILDSDILFDEGLTSTEVRLYGIVSCFSNNKDGYCYLSYSKLSELTHLSKRQLIRCINHLEKKKYIKKIRKIQRVYLMPLINKAVLKRRLINSSTDDVKRIYVDYDWLNEKN